MDRFTWRPVSVLVGEPANAALDDAVERGRQHVVLCRNCDDVVLHRSETANYRDNLAGDSALWVVLRPTERRSAL